MRLFNMIEGWMETKGLKVTPEKSEAVLLIRAKRHRPINFTLCGTQLRPVNSVRYLGITLDTRMTFGAYVKRTIARAKEAMISLARLMPRARGLVRTNAERWPQLWSPRCRMASQRGREL